MPKFKEGIKTKIHKIIEKGCNIKQAFISCIAGNYYIALSYEDNKPIPKPIEVNSAVGLDMGLANAIITSDKIVYPYKKFLQDKESKLKQFQRRLSKKQKGSNNRAKAIAKIAKLHLKISNARNDYLHKISNEIINQYDFIGVESLNIKGLIRNKHLSKSIANVAWGKLLSMLAYKAEQKGKTLMQIDKFFPSSQICSHCQTKQHRDLNSSMNIRNYALGMIDDRHKIKINKSRVGITRSYACGDSSSGVSKYGNILVRFDIWHWQK